MSISDLIAKQLDAVYSREKTIADALDSIMEFIPKHTTKQKFIDCPDCLESLRNGHICGNKPTDKQEEGIVKQIARRTTYTTKDDDGISINVKYCHACKKFIQPQDIHLCEKPFSCDTCPLTIPHAHSCTKSQEDEFRSDILNYIEMHLQKRVGMTYAIGTSALDKLRKKYNLS